MELILPSIPLLSHDYFALDRRFADHAPGRAALGGAIASPDKDPK
jgi:hypothetical protein